MKKLSWLLVVTMLVSCLGYVQAEAITTQSGEQKEAYEWSSVNIGGGGFVTGVISTCDDNIFYARTDVGGAYKLDMSTGKWTMLSGGLTQDYYGGLGVDSIAVDPTNANNVYIFCGYTYVDAEPSLLMRSTDGGKTFTYTELPFQSYGNGKARNVGERLVVDPLATNVLYCATRKQGVWKSEDYGSTWTQIRVNDGTTDSVGSCMVIADSSTPVNGKSTIYVADWKTSGQIYRYSGSDKNWTALDCSNIAGAYPQRYDTYNGKAYITFASTDFESFPESGFLGVLDFATGTIARSNVSWEMDGVAKNYPLSGISIDKNGSGRMIVSTLNTYEDLYWTEPATQTWGEDWGTALFTSTDGGVTWTDVNKTEKIYLKNGGKEWVDDEKPHWSGDVTFLPGDTSKAILTSGNGTYLLSDLFDNDSTVYATFYTEGMEETVVLDMVSPALGAVSFASVAYDAGGFCHTQVTTAPTKRLGTSVADDGSTIVHDKGVAIDRTGIAVCENDPKLMVVCGETETTTDTTVAPLQYSCDNGTTWYDVPNASSYGERGSCAVSANGSNIYWMPTATTDRYTENVGKTLCIFTYNKTSNTWGSITTKDIAGTTISGARVMTDTVNDNIVYVSSNEGLYYSTNKGGSFTKIASSDTARLNRMTVVPGVSGMVYEANGRWSNQSLSVYDITAGTNTVIEGVTACEAVGFGKAAEGKSFPTMFVWGVVNGKTGIFRSIDKGNTWIQINDDNTSFGGPGNGKMLMGDRRNFGRVYMVTYGQGVVYGDTLDNTSSGGSGGGTTENGSITGGTTENGSTANGTTENGSTTGGTTENGTTDNSSSQTNSTEKTTQESTQESTTGSTESTTEQKKTTRKKLAAPKKFKVVAKKKKKIVLSWRKVSGAKKYKVYYATKKKGKYKLYMTTKKTKVTTSKKLKAKKTYYFKVVAVDKKGKLGKASTIKKVKVKK